MYCNYCGTQIEEGAQFCPQCGAPVGQNANTNNTYYNNNQGYQQGGYNQYQQPFQVSPEVNSQVTTLLVLSILELVCCNQIFGGIGLVLAILAKSALSNGDFAKYEKHSKSAKYVLLAGPILALLCGVCYMGISMFSVFA